MKESEILHDNGAFFVTRAEFGTGRLKPKSKGFKVWKTWLSHSTLAASVGFDGDAGLDKAKAIADERKARAESAR